LSTIQNKEKITGKKGKKMIAGRKNDKIGFEFEAKYLS